MPADCNEEFRRGLALFNRGEYFECHEAWENVWRELQGDEKRFVQALIQFAVALHHAGHDNLAGARSLAERSAAALDTIPCGYFELKVTRVRQAVRKFQRGLAAGTETSHRPKLYVEVPHA